MASPDPSSTVALDSSIVATRLGAYAIKQMCRDFTYVDFCCVDSTILDPDSLKTLQDITLDVEATHSPAERVTLRISRIAVFLDYLVRCEERWVVEARRRELGEEWQRQIVRTQLQPAVLKDADAALRSAERRFGRAPATKPADSDVTTLPVDPATYAGKIVNVWPDKDYVFIRGEDGGIERAPYNVTTSKAPSPRAPSSSPKSPASSVRPKS